MKGQPGQYGIEDAISGALHVPEYWKTVSRLAPDRSRIELDGAALTESVDPRCDLMDHDVFTSVLDLKTKLIRYIRRYNKAPTAVKWKYFDPPGRIATDSGVTVH